MLDLGIKLYNLLPELYKREDKALGYPLRRFFQVMGFAFDDMEEHIIELDNMYDLTNIKDYMVDYLCDMFAISFHRDTPYAVRKRVLRMVPKLVSTKGSLQSFEYLAAELYGNGTSAKAYKLTTVDGMLPEDYRTVVIDLILGLEGFDPSLYESQFRTLAEYIRPVNTKIVVNNNGFFIYVEEIVLDKGWSLSEFPFTTNLYSVTNNPRVATHSTEYIQSELLLAGETLTLPY